MNGWSQILSGNRCEGGTELDKGKFPHNDDRWKINDHSGPYLQCVLFTLICIACCRVAITRVETFKSIDPNASYARGATPHQ